jgi:aryl-alcohol dehydrogenase-like predicted oxidoreductase
MALFEELNQLGRAGEDLVRTASGSLHSIHLDFLDGQIKLSCSRLKRSHLGGFLLHNPEYYFDQTGHGTSPIEYYVSNSFPFSTAHEKTTSLPRILALAMEASSSHHFELIQFPFNLIENEAQTSAHEGSFSLIETAQASDIVMLINRPLNANSDSGPVHLATYEEEVHDLEETRDSRLLEECLGLVHQRLDEVGIGDDAPRDSSCEGSGCAPSGGSAPQRYRVDLGPRPGRSEGRAGHTGL